MSFITNYLQDVVFSLFPEKSSGADIVISSPPKPDLGDFALNGFILARSLGISLDDCLSLLLEKIHTQDFFSAQRDGGHINLRFLSRGLLSQLASISPYPRKNSNPSTYIVDYIGTNVGKPFHIGHLCTPNIGQSIINTGKWLGNTMIGDTHIGDWGSLFGKLAYGMEHFGNEEAFEKDPIEHLFSLYVQVNALEETDSQVTNDCRKYAQRLSQGDKEIVAIWQKITTSSIRVLNSQLARLEITPDYNIGESFYEGLNLPNVQNEDNPPLQFPMNSIVAELLEKKIATKNDDGSVGIVFSPSQKLPSCILQKSDGTNLYLTSDLACIKYRLTNGWNPKAIIYCVDVRQELQFKQCFAVAKMAWPELLENTQLFHAANGFVTLENGAMSTRKGNIIRLSKMVDESFERVKTILESKGRQLSHEDIHAIAVGALKYSSLSQDRTKDVVFTWEKALSFEGNSGPYVQYAAVRSASLLARAGDFSFPNNIKIESEESFFYDRKLLVQLSFFESRVERSFQEYKPHIIANYLFELATLLNGFYSHVPNILETKETEIRDLRLQLLLLARDTLTIGLSLLSIQVPSQM